MAGRSEPEIRLHAQQQGERVNDVEAAAVVTLGKRGNVSHRDIGALVAQPGGHLEQCRTIQPKPRQLGLTVIAFRARNLIDRPCQMQVPNTGIHPAQVVDRCGIRDLAKGLPAPVGSGLMDKILDQIVQAGEDGKPPRATVSADAGTDMAAKARNTAIVAAKRC